MYILLEGVDGIGKSTQIKMLKKFENIYLTREPGYGNFGQNIRNILLNENLAKRAEIFLFLADRAQHYEKLISKKNIILSDRGMISGIAYAIANDESLDEDLLWEMNKFALKNNLPDKIILLIGDENLIRSRLKYKKLDNIEQRGFKFLLKVQEIMLNLLNRFKKENYLIINANKTKNEIFDEIQEFLKGHL